jgi:hypothetical protein
MNEEQEQIGSVDAVLEWFRCIGGEQLYTDG